MFTAQQEKNENSLMNEERLLQPAEAQDETSSQETKESRNQAGPQSESSSFSIFPVRSNNKQYSSDCDDDHFKAVRSKKYRTKNTFDGVIHEVSDKDATGLHSDKDDNIVKKMNSYQTFFAVVKAYCAINVLLLPRSFANGGYLLSPVMMLIACFFETLCAMRLTTVAQQQQIFSYPLLMQKSMGKKGLWIARICLALAHWQFTIGQMTFTLKSLQSTFGAWTGHISPLWVFGVAIVLLYSPIVWVRKLESYRHAFIFGVAMIGLGVVTTSVFAVREIEVNNGESGPDYVALNEDSFWSMIGFSFFMFEGIGCLIPIMRETEKPEKLPIITASALVFLCLVYATFSSLCYYTWGGDLNQPVVTEMLPADNRFVQVMKMLFCLNLVFSYPLSIVPTFNTLEALILGKKETSSDDKESTASESEETQLEQSIEFNPEIQRADNSNNQDIRQSFNTKESTCEYWAVNALRSCVVIITVIVVLFVADKLDKVMSVAGAVFGMINVLLLPAICHLKLTAETRCQKIQDILIMIFACAMLVFGPFTIILQWGNSSE